MARKEEIFQSFLNNCILKDKYELGKHDLDITLAQALNSKVPIIRSIAIIVDSMEKTRRESDSSIRNTITHYLNTAAL